MKNLRYFLELHLFGVCTAIGERLGISIAKIRMSFIYISFLTFGSPIIIYFILAFWRQIRNYMRMAARNPLKW